MGKITMFFIIILIAYIIYAFTFSIILFAFKNPRLRENPELLLEDSKKSRSENRDRVQLIESQKNGVSIRIKLIENARESIDISYYTFRNGKVAKMMLASILDAADRGVEVRILLDSLSFLPSLAGELKDIMYGMNSNENINWKFYHPVNLLFPFNWNKRLHDKMIIVDGNLALIGGRNIADNYYIGDTKWRKFSKDRDVLIFKDETLGDYYSVIEDMKNYYDDTWDYKYSKSLKKKLSSKEKNKNSLACENLKLEYIELRYDFKEELDRINWYDYTIASNYIEFVHNPVRSINHDPWCLQKILSLSSQAKESIFIQSPYIIPTRRIKAEFNEYDIDLEKIKILTNSYYSSPNYLSISAYSNHKDQMVDNKVKICEYQGDGSLHSKTYMFDDYISVVGSFNLDSRSSYINSETMIVIASEDFAEKLKDNIQVDLDKALKIDTDYSYILNENVAKGEISKTKKTIIAILSKIAPILEHLL